MAVDFRGEVYAIAKWTGLRTKDVRDRLGDGKDLPSVKQAKAASASRMTEMLRRHVAEAEAAFRKKAEALSEKRTVIVERQRRERADLAQRQQERAARESAERAKRLNKGFRGIWDRLTGVHGRGRHGKTNLKPGTRQSATAASAMRSSRRISTSGRTFISSCAKRGKRTARKSRSFTATSRVTWRWTHRNARMCAGSSAKRRAISVTVTTGVADANASATSGRSCRAFSATGADVAPVLLNLSS